MIIESSVYLDSTGFLITFDTKLAVHGEDVKTSDYLVDSCNLVASTYIRYVNNKKMISRGIAEGNMCDHHGSFACATSFCAPRQKRKGKRKIR